MYIIQCPEQKLDHEMGDVRFCSLLFHFLQARTSPVPSFSARTRYVRTHPHPCPDSAHGIPKKSCVVAAPPGMNPRKYALVLFLCGSSRRNLHIIHCGWPTFPASKEYPGIDKLILNKLSGAILFRTKTSALFFQRDVNLQDVDGRSQMGSGFSRHRSVDSHDSEQISTLQCKIGPPFS